jgi:uncharacterized damage-inducible protein DinB
MQQPWLSRQFVFDYPVERLPVFLSRLRGTTLRVEAEVRGVPAAILTQRFDGLWSIQEHVGHLHDIEALHLLRLDEIARGVATLTAADMENRATWAANHNSRPFAAVFADLCASRAALLERLERWDPARLGDGAMHPRLRRPMRAVDVAFFTAEHDDHHLAKMHTLVRRAGVAAGRS